MFDSTDAFAKLFTPVEGGYLYYPSKKSGGKLVTIEEYHELVEGWRKVAGPSGRWKLVGIVMLAIFLWILISKALFLPVWSDSVAVPLTVIGISGWFFWAIFAPRRLVRNRPVIAPPRPISRVKREVRGMLNWRFIIIVLFLSGLAFVNSLHSTERDFVSWAWLIGSGAMFGAYIWIAIQKFRDR